MNKTECRVPTATVAINAKVRSFASLVVVASSKYQEYSQCGMKYLIQLVVVAACDCTSVALCISGIITTTVVSLSLLTPLVIIIHAGVAEAAASTARPRPLGRPP